jgi:hypothetical protein
MVSIQRLEKGRAGASMMTFTTMLAYLSGGKTNKPPLGFES